jgi:peptide/nickel transport system substrate-binding protein
MLTRLMALGVSLPAAGVLLAACGSDDDEATATVESGAATPTTAAGASTPTTAADEPTAAGETPEPSPTSAAEEPTATASGEATQPPSGGGTFVDGGSPEMGIEFEPGQPGGILTEAGRVRPPDFTLGQTKWQETYRLVFEGLVEPNPFTLEPVGLLATGWETSEDGLTWTFFLREGVLWHDGETFTADDVVATYDLLLDEAVNSFFYSTLSDYLTSYEAVDEYTVAFQANGIRPDFLDDVAMQLIGAEHIISQFEPADWSQSTAATGEDPSLVVATGPFRLVEIVPDDRFEVARFDDYWNGTPYLDGVIVRRVGDYTARLAGLLTGEYDQTWEILQSDLPQYEEAGFFVYSWTLLHFDHFVFNLRPDGLPALQDVKVRQALAFALDREAMLLAGYEGFGEIAETVIAPATEFANVDAVTALYPYDPEQAMALLDEAGWLMGDDGIRQKDGERLAFTVTTGIGFPAYDAFVATAAEYWRLVGVDAAINQVDWGVMYEQMVAGELDVTLYDSYIGGTTPDRMPFFGCGQPDNYSGYCNEDVDALLLEARSTFDKERRIELYTQFQNIVLTDLPILPIVYAEGYGVANPRVHNPPQMGYLSNYWFAAEKVWLEP